MSIASCRRKKWAMRLTDAFEAAESHEVAVKPSSEGFANGAEWTVTCCLQIVQATLHATAHGQFQPRIYPVDSLRLSTRQSGYTFSLFSSHSHIRCYYCRIRCCCRRSRRSTKSRSASRSCHYYRSRQSHCCRIHRTKEEGSRCSFLQRYRYFHSCCCCSHSS